MPHTHKLIFVYKLAHQRAGRVGLMRCIMTFPDGETLTGEVPDTSQSQPQIVAYSGVTDRVRTLPKQATPGFLKWYFTAVSSSKDARLRVENATAVSRPQLAARPPMIRAISATAAGQVPAKAK